jgi:hypothetical protein
VLLIARSMCEAGTALAVMGNHEFNALGWAEPDGNGGFLRAHSQNNKEQHAEFLRQVGEGSAAHEQALEWFQTLPVWLDLCGLRVVHACWHAPATEKGASLALWPLTLLRRTGVGHAGTRLNFPVLTK